MQTLTPQTPMATPDIPELVKQLRQSFDAGRTRPIEWRLHQLDRIQAMLREHEGELVDALAADLGKPPLEAYSTDVGFVISEIEYVRKHLRGWLKPEKVYAPVAVQPGQARVHREPVGVVLVIAPWNYPVQLLLSPMVGAIAAGNCVIGKPSEVAPHTSAVIARLVPQYLDQDCIAIVEGAVAETTALLAERFDHIFYTGNGRVGRVVMEAAAKHLTPITLELGGKSPAIVDSNAKLDVAARRITWGKFLNAGQTCIAPDYVLVAKELEQPLVTAIGKAVVDFYGTDPKQSSDYARIVSDGHFRRLEGLMASGTPAIGGDTDASQRYIAPTVLQQVDASSPAMADEIFGPILPILPVDDVDEAIDFVNERDKPLALYIFSESDDVQHQVIEQTTSGGACVNATLFHVAVPGLPFGGVGPSGMGAYHGKASFECFTHRKGVLTRSTRVDPPIAYPPYTKIKEKLLRRFL